MKSQPQNVTKSCVALGTTAVSYDIVKVWYHKFKNKDYDIQEAKGPSWPLDVDETHLWKLVGKNQIQLQAKELDITTVPINGLTHCINFNHHRVLYELT